MTDRYQAYEIQSKEAILVVDHWAIKDRQIIRFKITDGHDYKTQSNRAIEYANFLNKQNDVMLKAAKSVTIVSAVAQRLLGTPDENAKPKEEAP